jgi:hypothetical protein
MISKAAPDEKSNTGRTSVSNHGAISWLASEAQDAFANLSFELGRLRSHSCPKLGLTEVSTYVSWHHSSMLVQEPLDVAASLFDCFHKGSMYQVDKRKGVFQAWDLCLPYNLHRHHCIFSFAC